MWSWHEEHGIFYAANYLRDLRIPRLDHGETEPLVADDESLNALRPGDMVALYHSSFGRFYGVVLEFDAGELTIATYEWADDDVPLTVATVEWFNVDIIPRSQLDRRLSAAPMEIDQRAVFRMRPRRARLMRFRRAGGRVHRRMLKSPMRAGGAARRTALDTGLRWAQH